MLEGLLWLLIFIAGYGLGRYHGWKNGFAAAEALLPLYWRQESYELGKCILCQAEPDRSLKS